MDLQTSISVGGVYQSSGHPEAHLNRTEGQLESENVLIGPSTLIYNSLLVFFFSMFHYITDIYITFLCGHSNVVCDSTEAWSRQGDLNTEINYLKCSYHQGAPYPTRCTSHSTSGDWRDGGKQM